MAKFFITSSHGSEHPTRASLALLMAKAAVEEGHQVKLALVGDAAVNIRDTIIGSVQGVGLPSYKELLDFLVAKQVNIFV
jgi:predicted peroxiredoxin